MTVLPAPIGGSKVQGSRGKRWVVAVAAIAVAAGSGVGGVPAGAQSGKVPGVTAKEIKIGAVVGKTNPNGVRYDQVVTGAEAYFDQVNKGGGVFGRQLKVVKVVDDQTRASKSVLAARSLVEESKVFAAIVASQVFAGAEVFVASGTPAFGYNIQSEWSEGPNLFGSYGSYICFDCPSVQPVFIAKQVGAKSPAVFAYGASPSSASCAGTQRDGFDRWGPPVSVFDTSLSFGFSANDISGAVQAMKDNDVDFVGTCMDVQGVVNLKKALQAAGIQGVTFSSPQGYDLATLEELGSDLEGFVFSLQFVPFEAAKGNPGMTRFMKAMKARDLAPNENLLVGWVSAELMVRGIRDAGKGFTQQSMVDAINQISDWTADGKIAPVDWTTAHGPAPVGEEDCFAYVAVEGGKFVPRYGAPGRPLVCFVQNPPPASLDDPTYFDG